MSGFFDLTALASSPFFRLPLALSSPFFLIPGFFVSRLTETGIELLFLPEWRYRVYVLLLYRRAHLWPLSSPSLARLVFFFRPGNVAFQTRMSHYRNPDQVHHDLAFRGTRKTTLHREPSTSPLSIVTGVDSAHGGC
jgi:hypothetical protein